MGPAGLTDPAHQFSREYFAARLKTLERKPLKGRYFRLVLLVHADAIEETGPGFAVGGRYNPANEFGALYLAETPELCWQEKLKYYSGRADAVPDQALGEFDISIHAGLDLTDAEVLKALGVKTEDIARPSDHYLTRMIGAAAWSLGIEALLVPSSIDPDMKNIVIFRDHMRPQSKVERKKVSTFNWKE